jgi:hypothetical protein
MPIQTNNIQGGVLNVEQSISYTLAAGTESIPAIDKSAESLSLLL